MFGLKTFRGGIHPDDKKRSSDCVETEFFHAPKTMVYPMQQHIGKPSRVLACVGDKVKIGQLIAEADGDVSANLHSSVSGTVTAIKPHIHPNGNMVESVIIENDFKNEYIADFKKQSDINKLSPEDIVKLVKDAGIVGMGGAAFPTHIKLVPSNAIDTVIINGAECEPYITSDHRLMLEHPQCILTGIQAVKKAVGAKNAVVCIENNKPDAIEKLTDIFSDFEDINVTAVRTKYPQGSEKQIIDAVTGRQVPSGGLPSDIGVVVLNVDTIWAIADVINKGLPLIHRVVTLSGGAVKNPKNYIVPLGTPIKNIIEASGGFLEQPAKILLGGPMMGNAVYDTNVPVIKGTGAIIALTEAEIKSSEPTACVRCGKCVDVCPIHLQPVMLREYSIRNDWQKLNELHIKDCIECGACTYICPGRQNPVQHIRNAKPNVLEMLLKGEI